jgi:hypothetical protein
MPMGDCARAKVHHAYSIASVFAESLGLLSNIDSNHASVASDVVQTSRLGPAARYSGIFAVSTVVRKRRVVAGRRGENATFGDARPTSTKVRTS